MSEERSAEEKIRKAEHETRKRLADEASAVTLVELGDAFKKISRGDDTVALVLRMHLVTEALLGRYLNRKMPRPEGIIKMRYFQKLNVAYALGEMEPHLFDALVKLNELRNRCSHTLAKTVTREEIEAIGRAQIENHPASTSTLEGLIKGTPDAKSLATTVLAGLLLSVIMFVQQVEHFDTPEWKQKAQELFKAKLKEEGIDLLFPPIA